MTDYLQIDPILYPWAKTHGLLVATQFKDSEVRSIQIVDDAADSYSLWINAPQENGSISVGITENTSRKSKLRQHFITSLLDLDKTLEKAYAIAESWIREKGHTRTPVL
jgi:hypothetical protein